MKPKVYVSQPIAQEVKDYLAQYCDVKVWDQKELIKREDLLKEIADVDGLITSGRKITENLLNHAPNLKVVSNISVGYNNFDIEVMKKRNIIGTNTPGVLDETVADLAFGLILASARRIVELDQFVKAGKWEPTSGDDPFIGTDVHSATLGIIGMGRIGEAIARRGKLGFNMDVLYYNRNRKPEAEEELGVKYSDLEPLLKQSDFVLLMTPLTPETQGMIGEKEFKLMKKSAIFINVSRGQTIDEQALIQALENKEIHAAALDVFAQEPVNKDNPLLKMPNVVTTPHIGSASRKTTDAMAMKAAKNMVAALTGEEPENRVV
ncbi:MAG TPA: D-glycerate dehydrogenase [Bacillus bacterium]|uniref:Bifunctional glyoxylate/hydroxypyruvate reductase B n=1 Tax=Siminovitchia fordii TaxID=254759 RepID=A0ABQ4K590_9BACI|nr:D-glycerate dehydrogenase [Siminovitchia fordii]GIN20894.1 bifunctional glyoxylate/hydroxypyruvate reductase B [Siminovitchia fordii]HBZ08524.1 D-glycerate dehydrogenase [Bacillus sp. (in: firmicutes)]